MSAHSEASSILRRNLADAHREKAEESHKKDLEAKKRQELEARVVEFMQQQDRAQKTAQMSHDALLQAQANVQQVALERDQARLEAQHAASELADKKAELQRQQMQINEAAQMQQAATSTYNDLVHKGTLAQSQLEAQANIISGQAQQINAAHMAENAAREQAAREHEEAVAKIANAHRLATDERAKRLAAESEVEAKMKAAMEYKVSLIEAEKLRTGA